MHSAIKIQISSLSWSVKTPSLHLLLLLLWKRGDADATYKKSLKQDLSDKVK